MRYSTCDLKDSPEQLCDSELVPRWGARRVRTRAYTRRLHLLHQNEDGRQMGEIGWLRQYATE